MLPELDPKYSLHTLADATFQVFCTQISSDYLSIIKRDIVPQLKAYKGISLRELRMVMVIDYFGDSVTSAIIAHELRYDKGTVSRTAQKLERFEYIKRLDNQEDARSSVFVLTEMGQTLASEYKLLCQNHFDKFSKITDAELTEEERKVALKILLKLRERTRRMLEPPQRRYRKSMRRA